MNLKDLENNKNGHRIIYRVVTGSHAYGLNNENSDFDEKGIFWVPSKEFLSLDPPVTPQKSQVSDENNDKTFYSLYRVFELLKKSNPNILEMLWIPEDCIKYKHPLIDFIIENRRLFISKELYSTHANYAYAQIKKAKGRNKRVHNPQPEERPSRKDFCYVIDAYRFVDITQLDTKIEDNEFPWRPVPLRDSDFNLEDCHAASMEQMSNTYRLYDYGDDAKGVFRGENEMLVCESIPKADEWGRFIGLLIYNEDAYKKAVKEWSQYWEWYEKRNDSRWKNQENGELDFDSKNMSHCVRLMLEAKNILENGEPIIRFEGELKDYLLDIKHGKIEYKEIIKKVESLHLELESLFQTSSIPDVVDEDAIDLLYKKMIQFGREMYNFEK